MGAKEVVFLYLYLKAKRVQVGTKGGANGGAMGMRMGCK